MTASGVLQIGLFIGVLLVLAKPLGAYMAAAYEGNALGPGRWLCPVEAFIYRLGGVRAGDEMNWKQYAIAMLLFHLVGFVALYGLQRAQALLPLNPANMAAVTPDSSFNTSVSFITNTN